jgi:hypothetical protein
MPHRLIPMDCRTGIGVAVGAVIEVDGAAGASAVAFCIVGFFLGFTLDFTVLVSESFLGLNPSYLLVLGLLLTCIVLSSTSSKSFFLFYPTGTLLSTCSSVTLSRILRGANVVSLLATFLPLDRYINSCTISNRTEEGN